MSRFRPASSSCPGSGCTHSRSLDISSKPSITEIAVPSPNRCGAHAADRPCPRPPRNPMSLQGNLRDFAATEILQLLGMQRKTGCLTLQQDDRHAMIFVHEGRIVSTRPPGMTREDPLLRFLLKAHRLSE